MIYIFIIAIIAVCIFVVALILNPQEKKIQTLKNFGQKINTVNHFLIF